MKLLTALVAAAALATAIAAPSDAAAAAPTNDAGAAAVPRDVPKSAPSASAHRAGKSRRMAERRARVRAALANPDSSKLRRMDERELKAAAEAAAKNAEEGGARREFGALGEADPEFLRRARRELWGNNGGNGDPYEPAGGLVEETSYYDKWQQAYRFLGVYIDCSNSWGDGSHDSGNNNNNNNEGSSCSRWMIWAAYVDPNYAGGGYDEYYGDDAPGSLDCHSPDTDWKLIGVYRQEFYQYIEQISKHLWAIDEYEYIVALAGLDYMTDDECRAVGYDEQGNQLYADVQPMSGGTFQMGLYSDAQCIELDTYTSYTYDDFADVSELDLGSKDATDDDAFHNQAYQYWQETQEYTLANLNTVYNDFRYCTSCVDYPTYQDGYFIGDDGTDDDDLINQCWKFYSHDSFNCDADCIAMGASQGGITWITYGEKQFGELMDGQYTSEHEREGLGGSTTSSSSAAGSQRMERLKANLFITFAGVVFVATFLAFAVARGSSKKKKSSRASRASRSSRSRRLLDDDRGDSGRRGSSSRRSQSRSAARGSSRSKSKGRTSKSVRSARSKSRSTREREGGERGGDYEAPKSRSQSRSRRAASSSRRERD